MKHKLFSLFFYSLLSTFIFGIIDACFFLIGELTVQKWLRYKLGFNLTMSELATGGLSASISIFGSSYVNQYLKSKKIETIDLPIIDALGIILGTIFLISIYNVLNLEEYRYFSNV
jgi:hypothetical protein